MRIHNYLYGRVGLLKGNVDLDGSNIKALLVKQGSSFMSDQFPQTVSDFTLLKEFASGGYTRKTLSGCTITPDEDRDVAIFTANDPTWTTLANDDLPIVGLIVIQFITSDADNIPLYGYEFSSPVTPGGLNYTFNFNPAGIVEL